MHARPRARTRGICHHPGDPSSVITTRTRKAAAPGRAKRLDDRVRAPWVTGPVGGWRCVGLRPWWVTVAPDGTAQRRSRAAGDGCGDGPGNGRVHRRAHDLDEHRPGPRYRLPATGPCGPSPRRPSVHNAAGAAGVAGVHSPRLGGGVIGRCPLRQTCARPRRRPGADGGATGRGGGHECGRAGERRGPVPSLAATSGPSPPATSWPRGSSACCGHHMRMGDPRFPPGHDDAEPEVHDAKDQSRERDLRRHVHGETSSRSGTPLAPLTGRVHPTGTLPAPVRAPTGHRGESACRPR